MWIIWKVIFIIPIYSHNAADFLSAIVRYAYFHCKVDVAASGLFPPQGSATILPDASLEICQQSSIFTYRYPASFMPLDTMASAIYLEWSATGWLAAPYFYFSGDTSLDRSFVEAMGENVQVIFHECHLQTDNLPSHTSLEEIMSLKEEEDWILFFAFMGNGDPSFNVTVDLPAKYQLKKG